MCRLFYLAETPRRPSRRRRRRRRLRTREMTFARCVCHDARIIAIICRRTTREECCLDKAVSFPFQPVTAGNRSLVAANYSTTIRNVAASIFTLGPLFCNSGLSALLVSRCCTSSSSSSSSYARASPPPATSTNFLCTRMQAASATARGLIKAAKVARMQSQSILIWL